MNAAEISTDEQPLRAELFSVEQLERHARGLAGWHALVEGPGPDKLLPRLRENESILLRAYGLINEAVRKERRIAPAAEWLLDNFYLIEEQIRTARRHFPKGYSRELPRLSNGARAGYPRVYDLAYELISHVDGRIDAVSLSGFISSYQAVETLKLGELWAVPIMLRLALIENLRRVAARVTVGRIERNLATEWAEKMLETVEKRPGDVVLVLADMARAKPPTNSAFVAELVRRIQGRNPALSLVMNWLEHQLADAGQHIEGVVLAESQAQAADQVSIGNSIGSLRFLASMDWREFVESMSAVERVLRSDPAGVYLSMDFATRDTYRHVVERIARGSHLTEEEVARKAIDRARAAVDASGTGDRTAHVGYFLVDKGLPRLERAVQMRRSPKLILQRLGRRYPLIGYAGAVAILTGGISACILWWAARQGVPGWALAAAGILPVLGAAHSSIALVNWFVSVFAGPRTLPRMDYSNGIDPQFPTMVVVPTMLTGKEAIDELIEGLEVRYLANRDPRLYFALLTDFRDAPEEHLPGDEALVEYAVQGITALNEKYAHDRKGIFLLFHRPRRWNEREGVWMGYERKRGKLTEFNSLLRGGGRDRFSTIVGSMQLLPSIEFVITLDTDTQLPRDAARQLVGTLAHPLNRARFDAGRGRVIEGYTILQPRVGVSLPSAGRSHFVRLFAGDPGIDPYTRTVSDLYQDLFGEGSFIGKGIYDVDAFEKCCANFRENTILSHDLLEGAYARAGLVSDVQLFEEYPSRFTADMARRHRWIRGDWQIAWWLLPRVPGPDGRPARNPISSLSRWKILDNLRRSLVSPVLVALLVLSWFVLPQSASAVATLFVALILALPMLMSVLVDLLRKAPELPILLHLAMVGKNAARQLGQFICSVVFLPYDAFVSLDAIGRTLWRILVSHRRLLEWQTANDAERQARTDLAGFWMSMWTAPVAAGMTGLALLLANPSSIPAAGIFLFLWLVSPPAAWWLSRPIRPAGSELDTEDVVFLEKLSRTTWRYFQVFIGPEHNWLPPDNFQEHPVAIVAPRTSPTNIGMALLANLSAYDFGFSPAGPCIDRTAKTLATMERLERYRGHFFNWYDTRTLQPLLPLYVSTVDSGNLMGHLLVLRAGLIELIDLPILQPRALRGVRDTARVLLDVVGLSKKGAASVHPPVHGDIIRRIERLEMELDQAPRTLTAAVSFLQRAVSSATEIAAALASHENEEVRWWGAALERECRDYLHELTFIAPWTTMRIPSEQLWRRGSAEQVQRLDELRGILRRLDTVPTLREVSDLQREMLSSIQRILTDLKGQSEDTADDDAWFAELGGYITHASERANQRIARIGELARRTEEFAEQDFLFLYDPSRELLSIGFNVSDHRMDNGFYDLLASEARLTSYVCIAQGQLPQEHWFAQGRMLTRSHGASALLSWSGSMFEYLMPMLVMPSYPNTLLDETCKAVVRRQIEYGRQRGVPWGMSESAYNTTDVHLNYQYRAFGVPGLGLKRGLAEDLVIAPYATVMSLMVAPGDSMRNLRRLANDGRMGAYGFYEAIDYTPARLPRGQSSVTVRSFMAHHQGMSLLSLAYVLLDRPMQRRFDADPLFRATDLLLHERVPKAVPIFPHAGETGITRKAGVEAEGTMRVFTNPNGATPEVHLLSNGNYSVMISSAGGGVSRWRDLSLTRWREDPTRDNWGTFCYIRDVETGDVWSTAHQPTLHKASRYEAIFTQARAEFRRLDFDIDTHTEISVSPEDDIELRRITFTNRGATTRTLEVTSYAEVVLAPAAAEAAHPAFSNLFVQTHLHHSHNAILCTRRPRSAEEQPPWMLHLTTVRGAVIGQTTFETDRSKFIGRGRTVAAPAAVVNGGPLGNTEGSVLDPIVAIRRTIRLAPDETILVDIVTGVTETRAQAVQLAEKYHDPRLADRVFEMAWTHSHVVLRQLNATEADAQIYGRLAGSVVYASSARRAASSIIGKNRRGQSGLWGYGISGDLPIVLLRVTDIAKLDLVRQVIQAHAYWRMKGLAVDLVIWNEDASVYRQMLHDQIMGLIAAKPETNVLDRPGGIFVRRGEQISEEDRVLLQTVARVVLTDTAGTLAEQVERRGRAEPALAQLVPARQRVQVPPVGVEVPRRDLIFFNGYGGFTHDGREYIVILGPDQSTPAPWINVIANDRFGTIVSESGGSYTWSENCHEFRLTPWHNDPVSDTSGEAFYIRDEESGRFWSPTPLPARGAMPYLCRHGFGYSVFEYTEDGISSELTQYVATDAPVKFARFVLRNNSGRTRRMSITGYWEWVLGELRSKTLMHVITEVDAKSGALFARNPYNTEFPNRVVFVETSEVGRRVAGDRTEFMGRNGLPANPAAMGRTRLSGKVGAGLDPCAAMQTFVELPDGQEREIIFVLGCANGEDEARHLMSRFRTTGGARAALEGVWNYWNRTLGTVYVETPDPAVNALTNGWLVYQVLSCRMWARSGFYQSGGAFGFRDQLQDSMALVHAEPRLMREHLLRAAARQFREGDVQHWWHPPQGRGVRTHFSDDYLWLPLAACRYVLTTGDTGVMDEKVHFLDARPVPPDQESYYDLPQRSEETATLYEHCVRAINNGMKFGEHGLPLMGCGDWNDGMNLVGQHGKGESVWLAFFYHEVLRQFIELARKRGDTAFAEKCVATATALRGSIERHGWDGEWYRRAYFDNGEPLGSHLNPECQIDSIPQSWAVLSGVGDRERSESAMEQVDERLVRRDARLIQLFDPPFNQSHLNPGYIKGYVPGVRENGGQYTHAAIWTVMAFAAMGDAARAWELFNLINPVRHGHTPEEIETYKVEPYVVAADVYAVAPHTGRGGWTWYTGSAGWMYRLILESLLGLRIDVDRLRFEPVMPEDWTEFKVHYRYRETYYHITIRRGGSGRQAGRVTLDGAVQADGAIRLVDDRRDHQAEIIIGENAS